MTGNDKAVREGGAGWLMVGQLNEDLEFKYSSKLYRFPLGATQTWCLPICFLDSGTLRSWVLSSNGLSSVMSSY